MHSVGKIERLAEDNPNVRKVIEALPASLLVTRAHTDPIVG
jgi:hypothetical protein